VSRVFRTTTNANGSKNYDVPIAPGATQSWNAYLRFGTTADTVATLAPEAFASFQAAVPNIVNWPDRRPIASWFISEGTDRTSSNPRGYLWNPGLVASNTSSFQSSVMNMANTIITRMNAMVPKPQGIIVWDLEGQEFIHAMTYVGHPDNLPTLAPEMDAVADQVFAAFRNAGYKVGVTIRPQDFGVGSTLPSTCTASATYNLADKFVLTTATPPNRGYVCTATNTWTVAPMSQPYEQSWNDDDTTILASLEKKISYAQTRWGATLFYIDSDVWVNGDPLSSTVFRTLQQQFPNALLIPETTRPYTFGTAAGYGAGKAFAYYGTPASATMVYPQAFSVIDIASVGLTAAVNLTLAQSVKNGDILLFPAWYAAPEVTATQSIYAVAATLP
jgi:hypothetical protein